MIFDRRWLLALGAGALALVFFVLQVTTGGDSDRTVDTGSSSTQTSESRTPGKAVSGMPDDKTARRESLVAATELIRAAGVRPEGVQVSDFLVTLGSGSTEGLSSKVVSGVVVPEGSKMEIVTFQTLVTLNSTLTKNGKVNPRLVDAEDFLVVDRGSNSVWVPVEVYSGVESPFYLQMVWSKDGWKLHPFALVQAVRQSASTMQGQSQVERQS